MDQKQIAKMGKQKPKIRTGESSSSTKPCVHEEEYKIEDDAQHNGDKPPKKRNVFLIHLFTIMKKIKRVTLNRADATRGIHDDALDAIIAAREKLPPDTYFAKFDVYYMATSGNEVSMEVLALIDTGHENLFEYEDPGGMPHGCISLEFLEMRRPELCRPEWSKEIGISKEVVKLQLSDGTDLPTVGMLTICCNAKSYGFVQGRVTLPPRTFELRLLVVKGLARDIILGTKAITTYNLLHGGLLALLDESKVTAQPQPAQGDIRDAALAQRDVNTQAANAAFAAAFNGGRTAAGQGLQPTTQTTGTTRSGVTAPTNSS